jgi:diguanylate cyclase (GGDEF)-like protein
VPQAHLPVRKHTYPKTMISIGVLITIVFMSVGAMVVGDIGRRDYARAVTAAENVLASIDAEITRNFELYDLSLQGVVDGLGLPEIASLPPALRQQVLFDRAATAKYLGSIFVLDRTGDLILDSRNAMPPPANHADREYFQVARDDSNGQMHLSAPWATADGNHLIAISRRLSGPDGSFRGVVVGTMRLSYFYGLLAKVKLGAHDRIRLIRTDGVIIMNQPFDFSEIGGKLPGGAAFARMLRDTAGTFDHVAASDGIERLFAYRHVGNSPLVLSYGQALQSVYAGWRDQALRLGGIVALVSIMNIALIVFLSRARRRGAIAEHSLAITAMTDGLTGLCNRHRFDEIFDDTWRAAQAENRPIAVLMIDVDCFKTYNDQFGHHAGDDALAAIAQCIHEGTRRDGDIAARYGGEEFIVLVTAATAAQAVAVGENIRALVLERRAAQHGGAGSTPTISVGVAAAIANQGMDPKELIKAADAALYQAKSNGRNRVELASLARLAATESLRTAA